MLMPLRSGISSAMFDVSGLKKKIYLFTVRKSRVKGKHGYRLTVSRV